MHHKFAVIDAHEANPVVITGSYTWTASAENQNDENVLIIYDAEVAQAYYQEYLRLYNALPAETIYTSPSAEWGLAACSDTVDNYGDGDIDLVDLDCYMLKLRWVYLPLVLR